MNQTNKAEAEGAEDALRQIKWDFPTSNSARGSIHSFHSYPARFIPEIPRAFLDATNPRKGSTIIDPFCGCGTSLVEAANQGYNAIGIDLNPIACLISRIKTRTQPDNLCNAAEICINKAQKLPPPKSPEIPNLLHWFKPDVTDAIARLKTAISQVSDENSMECLLGCLSSIIVRVSNQDSDTRYAAVEKPVSAALVYKLFETAATNLASLEPCKPADVKIINKSIFDVSPAEIDQSISLAITSPPYPNAYEYWLYHKYRMWWLDYDPLAVKNSEIGARAHFYTKRRDSEDFTFQMGAVFSLLEKTMEKEGYCCFICGDSKIRGQIVDNSISLNEAAKRNNFKLVYKSERVINRNRKSFNLHHARIQKEHVLVWQR